MLSVTFSQLAARSDVRHPGTDAHKAIVMVRSHNAPIRGTATYCGLSKSVLHHAKQAIENGREIGKGGRPPRFTFEEERRIVEHCLVKHREGHALTKVQLLDHVRVPFVCY